MFKLSVMYPHSQDATFDMDYYVNQHIPMVQDRLGDVLKGGGAEQGIAGGEPDTPPTFIAVGYLLIENLEDFGAAWAASEAEILGDLPNFTNTAPTVQISEIRL